jgi:GT2 family glycosyltransferase
MITSICIITVTYGNRKEYIINSLKKALPLDLISKIIVVNNNSNLMEKDIVNLPFSQKIDFLQNKKNLGSSGGFKSGIKRYLNDPTGDFVLFLDDDNTLGDNTLDTLVENYEKFNEDNECLGFLCTRKEMRKYWSIAYGGLSSQILNHNYSFCRFSVFTIVKNILFRFYSSLHSKNVKKNSQLESVIKVNNGYWSGLFISKAMVLKNPLPNEVFFVYKDDHEYIYNLLQNNLELYLVPNTDLIELDTSWASQSTKSIFSFPEMHGSEFRTYYSIRNTVYYEEFVLKDKSIIRRVNKFLYLTILYMGLIFRDRKRLKFLKMAISDGLQKRMGINENINP